MMVVPSPRRLSKAEVELLFDQLYECGDTLEELNKLKAQALVHPCKRRSKRWNVKSPDGSACDTPRINKHLDKCPSASERNKSYCR